MRVLGIETATDICASAIVDNANVLVERSVQAPRLHSERLISIIDECLHRTQTSMDTLDGIAISIGPGSFTGLRIGLSVAKGLAFSCTKPVVAVPTLEALAEHAYRQGAAQAGDMVFPMIDARRDEVYAAVYLINGIKHEEVIPPCSLTVHECINLIKREEKIIIMGDGAAKFQEYLQKVELEQSSRYIVPPQDLRICSAVAVALLGERKLVDNVVNDLETLEPLYVKDFYTLLKSQHRKVKI